MVDFISITKSRAVIKKPSIQGTPDFSIVSYNILADGHAQKDYKTSSFITAENLSEPARHKKILDELKHLDADIVCLQEMATSYFPAFLKEMQSLGYDGRMIARLKTCSFEGEATFYKISKFQLVDSIEVILADKIHNYVAGLPNFDETVKKQIIDSLDSYTVSLIFLLRSIGGNFDVIVGNAHVGYEKLVRPDKQCIQIHFILKTIVNLLVTNVNKTCTVICGDFNSWPNSAPNTLMKTGTLTEQQMAELKKIPPGDGLEGKSIAEILPELFMLPIGYSYKSAYEDVLGADELSTRYHASNQVRAVDYIYFDSDKISAASVTRLVDGKLLEGGAPNNTLPSDHLSLKAEFKLN